MFKNKITNLHHSLSSFQDFFEMKIFCQNAYIEITDPMEAIRLEVKFNLTGEGRQWSFIGDALYYFRDVEVRADQLRFMVQFLQSQESVRGRLCFPLLLS